MRASNSVKGVADILAVLIVMSITLMLSASSIAVLQEIAQKTSEEVPKDILEGIGEGVIVNPSPEAIPLSDITVYVDGVAKHLQDDDGDGVWEPGESARLPPIDDLNGDGMIIVSVLYKGEEIYYGVFLKPVSLSRDEEFVEINATPVTPTVPAKAEILVNLSDDVVVADWWVALGDENGKETVVYTSGVLDKEANTTGTSPEMVAKDLMDAVRTYEQSGVKPSLLEKYSSVSDRVWINASDLKNAKYLVIYARDITGKVSSKIISAETVLAMVTQIDVRIIEPTSTGTYWDTDPVPVSILVKGYSVDGLTVSVDGSVVYTVSPLTITDPSRGTYVNFSLNLTAGTHEINATAYNSITSKSDTVVFTVLDDQPPTITFIFPKNGDVFAKTVSGEIYLTGITDTLIQSFNVNVSVIDDRGVKKVEVYFDGANLVTDYSPPYIVSVNPDLLTEGTHTIEVRAWDNRNQLSVNSVTFAVNVDNAPTVSVVSPEGYVPIDPQSGFASVDIILRATDDFGVTAVWLEINGTTHTLYSGNGLISVQTPALKLSLPKGTYSFIGYAEDGRGQVSSVKYVFVVGEPILPKVKIVFPANGQVFFPGDPYVVAVSTASDPYGVRIYKDSSIKPAIESEVMDVYKRTLTFGPYVVVKKATISLSNQNIAGSGTIEIKVTPLKSYFARTAFKPRVLHGVADSLGKKIELDLPVKSRVEVDILPTFGVSKAQFIGSYGRCKYYINSAPEGAIAEGRVYADYVYYKYHLISIIAYEGGKKIYTFPEPSYAYRSSYHYRNYVGDLTLAQKILSGNTYIVACSKSPGWVYLKELRIPYSTVAEGVSLLVDGNTIKRVPEVSKNTGRVKLETTIEKGSHTLTLKSENGAFEYYIIITPEEPTAPSQIAIKTPWGETILTSTDGGTVSRTGDLSQLFGTYTVESKDGSGEFLVVMRYYLDNVEFPISRG